MKKDYSFIKSFIDTIQTAINSCGINFFELTKSKKSIGVAVSGGADSVALFVALANIAHHFNFTLEVLTINHNIRDESETEGDAQYVKKLCEDFISKGYPVKFSLKTFMRGEVERRAKIRCNGIEDAARYLRYNAFEEFAKEKNIAFLCLAHNKNDQIETILMRFLQGKLSEGIKKKRGIFIRPMLEITRNDIERFLNEQKIAWRTDSTNLDVKYMRNKIRLEIIPHLDKIAGWQNAVIQSAQKVADDNEALSSIAQNILWQEENSTLSMSVKTFSNQKRAIQVRLLYIAFNKINNNFRIPYKFICRICNAISKSVVFSEEIQGLFVKIEDGKIFIKKAEKLAHDSGFFAIIENEGEYNFPFGLVVVKKKNEHFADIIIEELNEKLENVSIPFCIRSRQIGDEVETSTGSMKSVSDILSDWKVKACKKDLIPLVQELTSPYKKIICVLGEVFGYSNWIVKYRG